MNACRLAWVRRTINNPPSSLRSSHRPMRPSSRVSSIHAAFQYSTSSPMSKDEKISYLSQEAAQQLDVDLMSEDFGFQIPQLMELAGFACAQAIERLYPVDSHRRILVACGPGNQGGDGLVLARHLWHFSYQPVLWYPKETDKDLYKNLKRQCLKLGISQLGGKDDEEKALEFEQAVKESDVVVDAIFGFSFKGSPRPPFARPLSFLTSLTSSSPSSSSSSSSNRPKIISIDIPSSWNVESGPPNLDDQGQKQDFFVPDALVSLTAPKKGVKGFKGRHFLGGRFVPPGIVEKYNLKLPKFAGSDQVVDITDLPAEDQ